MTIEVKHAPGSQVFILRDNCVRVCKVKNVQTISSIPEFVGSKTKISYALLELRTDKEWHNMSEGEIFASKEELLKSL